jgi:hypothetical protein
MRRPLNKQVIIFYYDGVNTGQFGNGQFVQTLDIRDACERDDCPNEEEHLTFDGQFFYRRKQA